MVSIHLHSPRARFISTVSGNVVEEVDSVAVTVEEKATMDMCMEARAVIEGVKVIYQTQELEEQQTYMVSPVCSGKSVLHFLFDSWAAVCSFNGSGFPYAIGVIEFGLSTTTSTRS